MRINSQKQTKASRRNGAKTEGPKSKEGKSKSAQNAIQDGLFSRQVVIQQLGEQQEDYDKAKKSLWQLLKPSNILEEMLATDYMENWWRRERIRRAEREELKFRLDSLQMKSNLRRSDEVTALRSRFWVLFAKYSSAFQAGSLDAVEDISEKLESVRHRLASTSLGVNFLVGVLRSLQPTAKSKGVLSDENICLLKACCGFGSESTDRCLKVNLINKSQSQKWPKKASQSGTPTEEKLPSKQNTATGPPKPEDPEQTLSKEDCCTILAEAISTAAEELFVRGGELQTISYNDAKRAKSLATIDAGIFDRFSRAETAVERRMYRALGVLSMMRAQDISTLLPDPRSKKKSESAA